MNWQMELKDVKTSQWILVFLQEENFLSGKLKRVLSFFFGQHSKKEIPIFSKAKSVILRKF